MSALERKVLSCLNFGQQVDLHEKVARLGLGVVLHVVRHNVAHQLERAVNRRQPDPIGCGRRSVDYRPVSEPRPVGTQSAAALPEGFDELISLCAHAEPKAVLPPQGPTYRGGRY